MKISVNLLFFVLVSAFTFSAHASGYETVLNLFKNGSLPDVNTLVNKAWVGRCFYKDYPDMPNGGVLLVTKVKGSDDAGPIGGTARYRGGYMTDSTPDGFDNGTSAELFATHTTGWASLSMRRLKVEQHELVLLADTIADKPISSFRKSPEGYIVGKDTDNTVACYFYKVLP